MNYRSNYTVIWRVSYCNCWRIFLLLLRYISCLPGLSSAELHAGFACQLICSADCEEKESL